VASGAYFGSMIGTLYAAMGLRIYLLVLLFFGESAAYIRNSRRDGSLYLHVHV
jgi:hypothetical protein